MVDGKFVEIPKKAIEQFIKWNQEPYDRNRKCDQKLVEALFFKCAGGAEHIMAKKDNQPIKDFLRGILFINYNNYKIKHL